MEFTMDERRVAAQALKEAEKLISLQAAARQERPVRAEEILEQGREKKEEESRKKEKKKLKRRLDYAHKRVERRLSRTEVASKWGGEQGRL